VGNDDMHDPTRNPPEPYELAAEDPTSSRPARPSPPGGHGRVEDDGVEVDGVADEVGEDASLPPPISRSDGVRIWLVVAAASTAVLAVSWLAGAPPLSLPVGSGEDAHVPELGPGARLVGLARTLVYLPLATFGATFGFLALAFVRQRPVGHLGALFAKSAAIVSVGMLVWLVPSDVRFIKQILNVAVVPLVAGALAVPVLRLAPRDAALATGFALMGMLFLVLASAVVVWAVGA
jgi:hypothetical protein